MQDNNNNLKQKLNANNNLKSIIDTYERKQIQNAEINQTRRRE